MGHAPSRQQDGVYHHRQHHGRHDRVGLCHGCALRHRRQLYVLALPWYSNTHVSLLHFPGVFFVVQSSQRRSIRALYSGDSVMSTVRRPGAHRAYLREVSKQTSILRLQGFMFFGTITHVEETIRQLFDEMQWQRTPIRFLIVDLALVAGVDMSAAEAFVRVQRLLSSRKVVMVLCGFNVDSPVGHALRNVGLLDLDGVELFATFNDAMECAYYYFLHYIETKSTSSKGPKTST